LEQLFFIQLTNLFYNFKFSFYHRMKDDKTMQYQIAVVAFLILCMFFVQTPAFIKLALAWVVIFMAVFYVGKNYFFALFLASVFVAISAVFLVYNGQSLENFDSGSEDARKAPDNDEGTDMTVENKPSVQIKVEDIKFDNEKPKKISMMDTNGVDDAFGKLDVDNLEDSDEDTDVNESEDNINKSVGSTKVSSKEAYKAQKQLYDLTVAVDALHKHMNSLTPSLKKGQKVIESLEKFGLNKFI